MSRITIDPLTRIEGHGRVEIFLDQAGEVADAYFLVPELRGFESLCVGRPAEELPRITSRICGLCPEAHHIASVKALDDLWSVEPPPKARQVRELFYSTFVVLDHATHFFVLAGPDLLLDPATPAAERSFFAVARSLGRELAQRVIEARARCGGVLEALGGRRIHAVAALPGGWSHEVSEEVRREVLKAGRANVEFALFSLELFKERVLRSPAFAAALDNPAYAQRTYSMGTVDPANRVAFYDGRIRVVDPDGVPLTAFDARDYREHIAERTESWTYLKMPYLKAVGWRGLTDGPESGVYCATPLARLNAADGMATPRAQEYYEELFETLGDGSANGRHRPVHKRLATHWARLVELLFAAERMVELAGDREIVGGPLRSAITATPSEGVGSVEAPRGTLIHHYRTDEEGIVTGVDLVVGTTNNHAPIALSIKRVAAEVIHRGAPVDERLLNRIELVIRAYDPCLSCATHALPGGMPLVVTVRDAGGQPVARAARPS